MQDQTISHYRILDHLGTNLIGEVYLAEDTHLGRKVVLQVLPEPFTRDQERIQRLSQEARILSSLNHPNIRMIYEVGQDRSRYFIANEFVDGPNLRVYLGSKRMKADQIIEIALQAVTGLSAAHNAGVLHRDLKPENIVIRGDGYIKIIDFGLAKIVEQDAMLVDLGQATGDSIAAQETIDPVGDRYGTKPLDSEPGESRGETGRSRAADSLWWTTGTMGYLSPEQIRGEPLDGRSDIFSLGVVIYEMSTGRLPFEGRTPTEMLGSIQRGGPPPVGRYLEDAPEEIDWILARALAREREDRYQTAREWLTDLKRLKQRIEFDAEQDRYVEPQSESVRRSDKRSVYATSPILRKDSRRESGRERRRDTGGLKMRSGSSRALGDAVDSLAILPLTNLSDDPNADFLSDGVTESIINTLSRVEGLRVMARSTVFRFKGRKLDPQEVGKELGVRAVFMSRLLQHGEDIVIKAELVDVEDGSLLWAEQYRRKSGDIFELEADIAKQISEHLKLRLSGEQRQGLAKRYTNNPEAYELYLRGRFYWNQRSLDGMKKGIECFVQAIRKDADYALAYAGMADCYMMLSMYSLPPREFVPKARISITRALQIDNNLAEAHASLGSLLFWYDWDFIRAEQEFKRAIELNPNHPDPHQWSAYLDAAQDRFDQALSRLSHAQSLDPLSIAITTNTAEIMYRAGMFDHAVKQCEKALEMEPQYAKALYWRVMSWIAAGRLEEAIEFLTAAAQIPGEARQIAAVLLTVTLARAGRREAAMQLFSQLEEQAARSYFPPYYLAIINLSLGDKEQAFGFLEKAYQERSGWMPWLKHEPLLADLQTDVRFNDLLRRVGLEP